MLSFRHLCTAPLGVLVIASSVSIGAAARIQQPSSGEVNMAALILGLTAESLACVDVQPSEISIVFDRLEEEYSMYSQLLNAQNSVNDAKQTLVQCNAILRDDPQNTQALQELETAQYNSIVAQNSITQLRQGLIAIVLEDLSDASMTSEVFHVSGVFQSLPAPYRLGVNDFDGAKELSWAIGRRNQAEESNSTVPSSAASILSAIESQYDVITGLTRIQQYELGNNTAIQNWMMAN